MLADAERFYSGRSRHLRPLPASAVPEGLDDLRAATCGACHREIYAEWRISTHARAWLDDPQFQAELEKSRADPERDVSWMCVNCHTPMTNQLAEVVVGLEDGDLGRPVYAPNPVFDPVMQLDAIGCATCHVRDGVVLGPWGDTDAPHPVEKGPELLTPEVCTQCHQARASFPELTLACVFDTGAEHAASPYAAAGRRCQHCHMPEVERPLVEDGPVRATRRHWFGGSLIPKQPAFAAELAPLEDVYPDGLTLGWVELPEALERDAEARLRIELVNAAAGHMLPTGDPERFVRVEATVRSADGAVLASLQHELGTPYQWYPEVKKLGDTRLAPLERRRLELAFVPRGDGPLTLELRASKWRIRAENLAYHDLEGKIVPGRTFFEDRRSLPLR